MELTDKRAAGGGFTPERVHQELLKALRGETVVPSAHDPAFTYLAERLNIFRFIARGWNRARREEEELKAICSAINTLVELLPKWRDIWANELALFNTSVAGLPDDQRANFEAELATLPPVKISGREIAARGDPFDTGGLDLAALDALVEAANVARRRGLPHTPLIAFSKRIEAWPHIAEDLFKMIDHVLPTVPKLAAYRFIAAVVPEITEDAPTVQAVRTQIMRKRPVR
jgi:hypothetical protein